MERRAGSHTEEEEMNQRRRLLNLARKGDSKAISKLFELYQVRILSGEQLSKINRAVAIAVARDKSKSREKGKPQSKGKPAGKQPLTKSAGKVTVKKPARKPTKKLAKPTKKSAKPKKKNARR